MSKDYLKTVVIVIAVLLIAGIAILNAGSGSGTCEAAKKCDKAAVKSCPKAEAKACDKQAPKAGCSLKAEQNTFGDASVEESPKAETKSCPKTSAESSPEAQPKTCPKTGN